jgi:DNA-binding transcriptional LysR family regulator
MCVREEAANGKLVTIKLDGVRNEWNLWLVRRKDQSLSRSARTFIDVSLAVARSLESADLLPG